MRIAPPRLVALALLLGTLSLAAMPRIAAAQPVICCLLPDNGAGTANHPPACSVGYDGQMVMSNGLPSPINIAANLGSFAGLTQVPGGFLGGMKENWTATLQMNLVGTGSLSSYSHAVSLPISTGESHSAPRTAYAPVQSFPTDLYFLFGQTFSDPDFDLLRVSAGAGYGYPSPGNTTFTTIAGAWGVDSYFDVYYRVDFIGKSSGPLGGMSGSTTGTWRFTMCHTDVTPVRQSTWGRVKSMYR
jgi:hypothetical protein